MPIIMLVMVVGVLYRSSAMVLQGPPPPSPPPLQCEFNGTVYSEGQSFQTTLCTNCTCGRNGAQFCSMVMCDMPPCVNAVTDTDQCCPVCPDGPNCLIGDVVIPAGEDHKTDNTTTCRCNGLMVECTLEKLPGCMFRDKHYPVGSFKPSPCEHCHCDEHIERVICAAQDCFLTCVDAVIKPDVCCPVCPNGPNCLIDKTIVADGEVYQKDNTTTCRCDGGLTACTGTGCVHNGTLYPVGPFQPSPCEDCFCDGPGRISCMLSPCLPPLCVDPVKKPDICCPVCPNGNNCNLGNKTIPAGQNYHDGDTICRCPDTPFFGLHAICLRAATPANASGP